MVLMWLTASPRRCALGEATACLGPSSSESGSGRPGYRSFDGSIGNARYGPLRIGDTHGWIVIKLCPRQETGLRQMNPLQAADLVFLRSIGGHLKLHVGENLDSNLRAPSEWVL